MEKLEVTKNAIFAICGALKFYNFGKLQPSNSAKIHANQNLETLNVAPKLILTYPNEALTLKV